MKITLFHNPNAGHGDLPSGEIIGAFTIGGHEVLYQSTREKDYTEAFYKEGDLIAVAGGDGTVRKVLRHLATHLGADEPKPVLILPVGTANNIARATSTHHTWQEAIAGLETMRPREFRHGTVKGCGVDEVFFESVGMGLFADYMHLAKNDSRQIDALAGELDGFAREYLAMAKLAASLMSTPLELLSEATVLRPETIWLEVLNIPAIGPRLSFGADARGADFLVAALATATQRPAITDWLAGLVADEADEEAPAAAFGRMPVEGSFRISWRGRGFHIDDEDHFTDHTRELDLEIRRSSGRLMIFR